jgi:hypothetical protein
MNLKRWGLMSLIGASSICACGDGEDGGNPSNGKPATGSAATEVCERYCMTADCPATYCTSAARRACEAYCEAEDPCDASTEVTDCYDYQCNHQVLPLDTPPCQAATVTYYECLRIIAASCAEGCDAEGMELADACSL